MKIRDIELKNNIILAPMAGVSDKAFRLLCKSQGVGLLYSEMVSAKGIYYKSENSFDLMDVSDEEHPISLQIFGSDPKIMAYAACIAKEQGADIIDINMGCPTPKIVKNGNGCALMLNIDLAREIVKSVVLAVNVPVTVKIRKGWDDHNVNAIEVAKVLESEGISAIAIHGRTREQFYHGKADWDIIRKVKNELSIPVIGNGDILTPHDAKRMLEYTGCDAVMIGRGAQGNPWIFKRTAHYIDTGLLLDEPSYNERIDMIIKHIDMEINIKGKINGIKEMRKHIAWYIKGMPNSAHYKDKIFRTEDEEEVREILNEYSDILLEKWR